MRITKRHVFILVILLGGVVVVWLADSDELVDASEAEEYRVYDALIKERFHEKLIVINDNTSCGLGGELSERIISVPGIEQETLDDFIAKNEQSHALRNYFNINAKVILISQEKRRKIFEGTFGWSEFYVRYPFSQGIMTLSRVGFNTEMSQALVYIGNQKGGLWGSGYYVLLTKEEGTWTIQNETLIWIS